MSHLLQKAHSTFNAPLPSPLCVTHGVNGPLHPLFAPIESFSCGNLDATLLHCKTAFRLPAKLEDEQTFPYAFSIITEFQQTQ